VQELCEAVEGCEIGIVFRCGKVVQFEKVEPEGREGWGSVFWDGDAVKEVRDVGCGILDLGQMVED
jgi:hypothetical protein